MVATVVALLVCLWQAPGGLLSMSMACPEDYRRAGEVVTCEYVLQNTSSVELWDPTVDATRSAVVCRLNGRLTLGPWETVTCTGQVTVTQADVFARRIKIDALGGAKVWVNGIDWLQVWSNGCMFELEYAGSLVYLPLAARE